MKYPLVQGLHLHLTADHLVLYNQSRSLTEEGAFMEQGGEQARRIDQKAF